MRSPDPELHGEILRRRLLVTAMLSSLLLAFALNAAPRCELPDLYKPRDDSPAAHRVHLKDGSISVAMVDPMSESDARLPGIPDEPPPVRQHSKNSLWLWSEASDWLLIPSHMQVQTARVGVDGSWVIALQDAKSPSRRLRAQGMGACVGCAYGAGAQYFKSYSQQARDNEFEYCRGLERPIVRDAEDDTRLRFHFDNQGSERHDAVAIIGDEDIGYSELVVSGLDEAVRDEVLEAFGR